MSLETILIIPDCHHPYVNVKSWELLLRVGLAIKPQSIVILGDFADGASLSAHGKSKPMKEDFEDELVQVRKALTQLDQLGAEDKVYVEGNHEQRLSRYLAENAPAVFRSMNLPATLDLKGRGWKWVPYRTSTKIGKLNVTHDTGSAGANAARRSADLFKGSAVIGHTHRMSYEVVGRFGNTPYLAAMFGWLGSREASEDYMHDAAAAQWVQGFGVGYREPNGFVHCTPVPIIDGRCVVNGKLFK